MNDIWKENKIGIIIAVVLIIVGVALFVSTDSVGRQERMSGAIYKDMRLKVSYAEDGTPKLFASVEPARLKRYVAAEGENIPTANTMVIGAAEATMMREEKLFTNVGDGFDSFFGVPIRVGGVLKRTNTTLDELHFFSSEQFAAIGGESGRVFILRTPEGMPKLFYVLKVDEKSSMAFTLAEGTQQNYVIRTENGKTYYPVFVGSVEATMMREEKLFTNVGDTIDGFFGTNIVIAGILAPTGTATDMMHIIPLDASASSRVLVG